MLGSNTGDYIGFWRGPIKGYITNLVQGSYGNFPNYGAPNPWEGLGLGSRA